MRSALLAALALASASGALPAIAQTAMPLTYAAFEPSVMHLDLMTCPPALVRDGVCRVSIGSDMVHVWVFEEDGDQQLSEVHSFGPDQYELMLN